MSDSHRGAGCLKGQRSWNGFNLVIECKEEEDASLQTFFSASSVMGEWGLFSQHVTLTQWITAQITKSAKVGKGKLRDWGQTDLLINSNNHTVEVCTLKLTGQINAVS